MKKILFALFIQVSFSAFAGDLFLVCEDEQNDDFVSASIEKGKGSLMLVINEQQPLLLEVVQNKNETKSLFNLRVKALRLNKTEEVELSLFEEVALGPYICLIRD